MEKAEEASRLLNHNYLGTEHLLLGLVADPETVSARALALMVWIWRDSHCGCRNCGARRRGIVTD